MGEDLKQKNVAARLEQPVNIEVHFARKACVTDLQSGQRFGRTDSVKLTLDAWRPTLLALTEEELPRGRRVRWLARSGGQGEVDRAAPPTSLPSLP